MEASALGSRGQEAPTDSWCSPTAGGRRCRSPCPSRWLHSAGRSSATPSTLHALTLSTTYAGRGPVRRHPEITARPGHHATPRRRETLSMHSCSDTELPGRTVTAVVIEHVGGHASAAMVRNETFEASVGNCQKHIGVGAVKNTGSPSVAVMSGSRGGRQFNRSGLRGGTVGTSNIDSITERPIGALQSFGDIGRGDNAGHLVALNPHYSAPGRRLHALQQCSDRLVGRGGGHLAERSRGITHQGAGACVRGTRRSCGSVISPLTDPSRASTR